MRYGNLLLNPTILLLEKIPKRKIVKRIHRVYDCDTKVFILKKLHAPTKNDHLNIFKCLGGRLS